MSIREEMRFFVRIYREDGDYSAMVPNLPGCVAAGDSVEEVRDLISQAIFLHLEMMVQSGEKFPDPTEKMEFVIEKDAGEEFCTWVEVQIPQLA
jgi:predicted RNase H-like HicB family nuclease